MAQLQRQTICSRRAKMIKSEAIITTKTLFLFLILLVNIGPGSLLKLPSPSPTLSSSSEQTHEQSHRVKAEPHQKEEGKRKVNKELLEKSPDITGTTFSPASTTTPSPQPPSHYELKSPSNNKGKGIVEEKKKSSNFGRNIQDDPNESGGRGRISGNNDVDKSDGRQYSPDKGKTATTFDLVISAASPTSTNFGKNGSHESGRIRGSLKNDMEQVSGSSDDDGVGSVGTLHHHHQHRDAGDVVEGQLLPQKESEKGMKEANNFGEGMKSFGKAFLKKGNDIIGVVSGGLAVSQNDMGIVEKFEKGKEAKSIPSRSEQLLEQLSPSELRDENNDRKMTEELGHSSPATLSIKGKDDIAPSRQMMRVQAARNQEEEDDDDGDEEVGEEEGKLLVINKKDRYGKNSEEFDYSIEGAPPEGIDSLENSSTFYYHSPNNNNKLGVLNQSSSSFSRRTFANTADFDRRRSGSHVVRSPDFEEIAASTSASADEVKLYRLVQRLLKESPLIDGHNDLPWNLRKFLHGQLLEFDFNSDLRSTPPWSKSVWSHTDLPRLRRGLVGAQFWVAYAPCESQNLNAVQITLEQIDLIRRLIARYPENLTLALSADDIERAHKEGKIASLIAVEGGHSIGNSLATLRSFYDLGVRYMTLTHNCNTPWADSARPGQKPEHGGLTEFGRAVVHEMNRLGMLVDLSHTSKLTMKDALKVSKAPVIFSHSSAFALCNSSRNVPDDILKELVWNRGIIMVTFYNIYVKCHVQATVRDVADHINYIRGKIGIEHTGIGSDFDGINYTPVGLEDVSKFPNLFVELARSPNWSNNELKMVAGKNFLRVFREAEHIRDSMRSAGTTASFELIPPRDTLDSSRCRYNTTSTSSSIH